MRKFFFPLLILVLSCQSKPSGKSPENKDYLVSLDGIGSAKTSMKQDEIEQVIGKKIPLTNPQDTISGSWEDSATVQYHDAELRLGFVRTYVDADSFYMRVTGMKTQSPLCKTEGGIGIGSGKQQIIDAYGDHVLIMAPDFADTTYTTRSKSLYSIKVRKDWEGPELIFYLKDNKVYAVEVGSFHDDSE